MPDVRNIQELQSLSNIRLNETYPRQDLDGLQPVDRYLSHARKIRDSQGLSNTRLNENYPCQDLVDLQPVNHDLVSCAQYLIIAGFV